MVVVSADDGLVPDAWFPDQVHQLKGLVRWLGHRAQLGAVGRCTTGRVGSELARPVARSRDLVKDAR
jgi:hypothetical protein